MCMRFRWLIILVICLLLGGAERAFAGKVLVNVWDGVEWNKIKSLYD